MPAKRSHPKLRGSWLLRSLSRLFLVVVVVYIMLPVAVTRLLLHRRAAVADSHYIKVAGLVR